MDKFLGWKVVDELAFPLERNAQQDTPYTIYQEKMKLQKNKEITTFVVIVRDPDIWNVEIVDEKGQKHGMNGVSQEDIKIRYMYSENEFAEEATYYMYSYDEELLYTESGQ